MSNIYTANEATEESPEILKHLQPCSLSEDASVRSTSTQKSKKARRLQKEDITKQHEELTNYISSSWLLCSSEPEEVYTPSTSTEICLKKGCSLYYEDGPRPELKNFKPFELELWWGKRLYASLTSTSKDKELK